jgi:protein gp37
MYEFVAYTWNPVKGKCPYECSYCYVQRICQRFRKIQKAPYFDSKDFSSGFNAEMYDADKIIFVCSSIDLFAEEIPSEWVNVVFEAIVRRPWRTYLLHTKNPARVVALANTFLEGRVDDFDNAILCATIESDIWRPNISKAPNPVLRFAALRQWQGRRMITVEPIMQFNRWAFGDEIISCKPEQVNIGADSGGNNLPEPSAVEVLNLIADLEKAGIKVVQKKNLGRLLK